MDNLTYLETPIPGSLYDLGKVKIRQDHTNAVIPPIQMCHNARRGRHRDQPAIVPLKLGRSIITTVNCSLYQSSEGNLTNATSLYREKFNY